MVQSLFVTNYVFTLCATGIHRSMMDVRAMLFLSKSLGIYIYSDYILSITAGLYSAN